MTRRNDRRLHAGSGWVRNGDRWQVLDVHRDGRLDVLDPRTHRRLTLPASYVSEHVELGYASTIHGAQGLTADTCHGLVTGRESRQQLYTMLSRGRHAAAVVSGLSATSASRAARTRSNASAQIAR